MQELIIRSLSFTIWTATAERKLPAKPLPALRMARAIMLQQPVIRKQLEMRITQLITEQPQTEVLTEEYSQVRNT